MKTLILIISILFTITSCKSLSEDLEKDREVTKDTKEEIKDYIGKELSVLYDDFSIESCELKIAYFKDVYAVKFFLKKEQEIIVILKNKVELSKSEIQQGCPNDKIKSGIISKIRFYKNGKETLIDNVSK